MHRGTLNMPEADILNVKNARRDSPVQKVLKLNHDAAKLNQNYGKQHNIFNLDAIFPLAFEQKCPEHFNENVMSGARPREEEQLVLSRSLHMEDGLVS
jgi:hypothetical protein